MEQSDLIYASIIVCTYNQEKWIRQTLDSILSQETSYSYEIIIGEDGGTDSTRSICQDYASKYTCIKLLPQKPNMGVTANWIQCIKNGRGKYIMGCAGDDFWHNPHKLQIQVDYMEAHPDCVLCHTDYDALYVKGDKLLHNHNRAKNIFPPEGRIQKEILGGKEHISAVTMCFRRDVFEKYVPTDKFIELKFPREDWPTLLILSALGNINYIPISTATYRIGQESISNEINYDKIVIRAQRDKVMTEFLYSLFPDWGEFKDAYYYDNIAYHHIVMAAYHNNDYKVAHEFAQKDVFPNKATLCAKYKITFILYRFYGKLKNKF